MREPTREEVEKALQSFCCNKVEKCHVDIIMALLEDKTKPKWEEEYFNLTANGMPDDEAIEAFIREKLREVCDDALACVNNADDEEVRKKWGL